ncbi:MAG: hypothetical protein V4490_01035 [Pseudomonadota bacterium]
MKKELRSTLLAELHGDATCKLEAAINAIALALDTMKDELCNLEDILSKHPTLASFAAATEGLYAEAFQPFITALDNPIFTQYISGANQEALEDFDTATAPSMQNYSELFRGFQTRINTFITESFAKLRAEPALHHGDTSTFEALHDYAQQLVLLFNLFSTKVSLLPNPTPHPKNRSAPQPAAPKLWTPGSITVQDFQELIDDINHFQSKELAILFNPDNWSFIPQATFDSLDQVLASGDDEAKGQAYKHREEYTLTADLAHNTLSLYAYRGMSIINKIKACKYAPELQKLDDFPILYERIEARITQIFNLVEAFDNEETRDATVATFKSTLLTMPPLSMPSAAGSSPPKLVIFSVQKALHDMFAGAIPAQFEHASGHNLRRPTPLRAAPAGAEPEPLSRNDSVISTASEASSNGSHDSALGNADSTHVRPLKRTAESAFQGLDTSSQRKPRL